MSLGLQNVTVQQVLEKSSVGRPHNKICGTGESEDAGWFST